MGKTFLTVFPNTKNVHLAKDVGMIPFLFYKKYGFKSIILTCNNGPYDLLNSLVNGLELEFLPSDTCNSVTTIQSEILRYIKNNALKITVLHLFDISGHGLKIINTYLKYNKKGLIYVKLDRGLNYEYSSNPLKLLREKIIELGYKRVKFLSVESNIARSFFTKHTFLKPYYIPNGFYGDISTNLGKNKTILFVGDVSVFPKRIDLVLEAFNRFLNEVDDSYQLRLVGPLFEDFTVIWEKSTSNNLLTSNTHICGPIYNKKELENEYKQAAIIVLASDHESFGIVLVEGARFGCLPIVSSGVASAYDITDNERLGCVFQKGSVKSLFNAFCKGIHMISPEMANKVAIHAKDSFEWTRIVKQIHTGLFSKNGYLK